MDQRNHKPGIATAASSRALAVRYVAAQVVVFLLFAPYITNLLKDNTRYLYMWRTLDLAALLVSMVLAAAACVLADEFIRRMRRPLLLRIFEHLFVLALGAGLLANLWFQTDRPVGWRVGQFSMEMQTLWLLLVGVVGYSFAKPTGRLVHRSRQLCLVLSPVMLIVTVQLLLKETYPSVRDPLAKAVPASVACSTDAAPNDRPVYVFVFDEWSYERTWQDGSVCPQFANLAALADRSFVFHDAHSPGEDTASSMPRFLFQTDLPVVVEDGRVGFDRDGVFVPGRDCRSIFTTASDMDYHCFMVGIFLPYPAWLGDQVDVHRPYCWYRRGDSLLTKAAVHAFSAAYYLTDPWSTFLYVKLKTRLADDYMLQLYRNIDQDVLDIIRTQPGRTFAVFHYPLPHEPYVLNVDGSYRGLDSTSWQKPNVEGYERNLTRLDGLVGEFINAMKEADRFDDALVILTSDHSWRFDPARTTESSSGLTHVPLIVKLPGQTRSIPIASRFETRTVGRLIDYALQTQGDAAEGVARVLKPPPAGVAVESVAGGVATGWRSPGPGS